MTAGFIPPAHWGEQSTQLRRSATVTLDANGKGTCEFTPQNANQRWVINAVNVSTNQSALATLVPYATLALNTTDISMMSPSNNKGTTWDGNNDSFDTAVDVGPCDNVSVLFYPPPGQSGATLAGVRATAVIDGTSYTRRSLCHGS